MYTENDSILYIIHIILLYRKSHTSVATVGEYSSCWPGTRRRRKQRRRNNDEKINKSLFFHLSSATVSPRRGDHSPTCILLVQLLLLHYTTINQLESVTNYNIIYIHTLYTTNQPTGSGQGRGGRGKLTFFSFNFCTNNIIMLHGKRIYTQVP